MKRKKSVGAQGVKGGRMSAGVGYIYIPNDRDRKQFITYCMNTGTVSILTDNSEYLNEVQIDAWTLQQIEWPDENNNREHGSIVVWINIPFHNQPVVVAKVNRRDEIVGMSEDQFKLNKTLGDNTVEIVGDARRGQLAINVNGGDGRLDIDINNEDQSSQLNLQIKGNININCIGKTNIQSSDEMVVYGKKKIIVKAEETQQLGDGDEPIVLGDTLKELLDSFIDEVSNITTTTSLGQMPILNKVQILEFKEQTEKFLSENSTTD